MQQLFTVYYPSLLQHVIQFLSLLERSFFQAEVVAQLDAAFTQAVVFWMTPFITHHLTRMFDVVSTLFIEKNGRLQLQAEAFPRFQKLLQGDLHFLGRRETTRLSSASVTSQEAREALCQHIARNVAKALHLYGSKLENLCFAEEASQQMPPPTQSATEEEAISLSRDLLDHLWHMMARAFQPVMAKEGTLNADEERLQKYARRIGFALDDFGAIVDASQRTVQKRKKRAQKMHV